MQYFTIFQDKLHSFNIQNHWTIEACVEVLQNRSKILTFDKRQICSERQKSYAST